jgi:hypothetical protein
VPPNERHSTEPNMAAEVFVPFSTPSRSKTRARAAQPQ